MMLGSTLSAWRVLYPLYSISVRVTDCRALGDIPEATIDYIKSPYIVWSSQHAGSCR